MTVGCHDQAARAGPYEVDGGRLSCVTGGTELLGEEEHPLLLLTSMGGSTAGSDGALEDIRLPASHVSSYSTPFLSPGVDTPWDQRSKKLGKIPIRRV